MAGFGIIVDKIDDYIHFKVQGSFPGREGLLEPDLIKHACKEHNCNKVLLDVTELDFNPNVKDLIDFKKYINKLNREKKVKMALLRSPSGFDKLVKIFEKKKVEYFKTFTDKNEALDWL